jgi:hypothetical protein
MGTPARVTARPSTAASSGRAGQVESLLDAIDSDLWLTLAHLVNADDEVAAMTLGLVPFGSRSALVGYGIIDSDVSAETDQAVEVTLTSFGPRDDRRARSTRGSCASRTPRRGSGASRC